jgi:hypothetical protein
VRESAAVELYALTAQKISAQAAFKAGHRGACPFEVHAEFKARDTRYRALSRRGFGSDAAAAQSARVRSAVEARRRNHSAMPPPVVHFVRQVELIRRFAAKASCHLTERQLGQAFDEL